MTALARLDLPDWPRLMSEELAARYLGLGATTLESLPIAAKRIGRRKLYDRRDLDRWADALGGQPLDTTAAEETARDVEQRWRNRRKGIKCA
jgi:hypothetical protein